VLKKAVCRGTASSRLRAFTESTRVQESAMLDPPKPRCLDEPVADSLEDRVPWNHVSRHLKAALDVRFVCDGTRECYADYLKQIRGYHVIEPSKKAICKRRVWVKPLFAEAKERYGLRRLTR
jgi:hypothetical protein